MEPTKEQLEDMERMMTAYKADMVKVEEEESKMYADGEIGIPLQIDPNGPDEFLDTPETTTEIFSGDPIECPEPPQAKPGTFLHWLACQNQRNDPIGDLARDYINDITYNNVGYRSYSGFSKHIDSIGACDGVLEALVYAKTEFDDFMEEEATYRDEQHLLELQKNKHVGC